jgi:hypothetical protein
MDSKYLDIYNVCKDNTFRIKQFQFQQRQLDIEIDTLRKENAQLYTTIPKEILTKLLPKSNGWN